MDRGLIALLMEMCILVSTQMENRTAKASTSGPQARFILATSPEAKNMEKVNGGVLGMFRIVMCMKGIT